MKDNYLLIYEREKIEFEYILLSVQFFLIKNMLNYAQKLVIIIELKLKMEKSKRLIDTNNPLVQSVNKYFDNC